MARGNIRLTAADSWPAQGRQTLGAILLRCKGIFGGFAALRGRWPRHVFQTYAAGVSQNLRHCQGWPVPRPPVGLGLDRRGEVLAFKAPSGPAAWVAWLLETYNVAARGSKQFASSVLRQWQIVLRGRLPVCLRSTCCAKIARSSRARTHSQAPARRLRATLFFRGSMPQKTKRGDAGHRAAGPPGCPSLLPVRLPDKC